MKRVWRVLAVGIFGFLAGSCGSDEPVEPAPAGIQPVTITIKPAVTHQEMIGFGGALSWYSNWMTTSSNKDAIANLIFTDLGLDLIRFKNWYYPDGYPAVTSTDVMPDDNSKPLWDATNELHQMAKSRNPNVKVLLSSWGPPAALKSNNTTREGTLKKDGSGYMYDAYADYWVDILEHVPFSPEYISIQNEPTYVNSGWTTCQWSATETPTLASYHEAFDRVYNKIKDRTNPPIMIGPESQDVPTFIGFANILKDKPHCGVYAYHPYNINGGTSSDQINTSLTSIAAFNTKPNIMSEFSDNLSWFNTAMFIQKTLTRANSSGYIYWKLVWATPAAGATDAGMVSVNSSGAYTVTPFYYLIKHFSRHIDAGYKRVDASTSNANLNISAFINPASTKLTLIIINSGPGQIKVLFEATGKTVKAVSADQSKEGSYYKSIENTTVTDPVVIPSQTITTVVLDI